MKSLKKFLALNGVRTRGYLEKLAQDLVTDGYFAESARLAYLLNTHKNESSFDITLSKGLNGENHKGIAKEALNSCGRLKPGYYFKKGGSIHKTAVKKNKKVDSPKKTLKKEDPKKKVNTEVLQDLEKKLNETNRLIENLEKERSELKKKYKETNDSIFWKKQNGLYALIEARLSEKTELLNAIAAVSNGGSLITVEDKIGNIFKEIPDFSNVDVSNILFDVDTILNMEIPPYIPLLDPKVMERIGYVFDGVKIENDKYLISTSRHGKDSKYVIITLDQLVLTSQYYQVKAKAGYILRASESNKRAEERWDNLDPSRKERYLNQRAQQAVYKEIPAKIKKQISFDKWTVLDWREKEKIHKHFKKTGVKRVKSKLDSKSMFASLHKMYEQFVNPKAKSSKPRIAHPEVWEYWTEYRENILFKITDLDVQRLDYSEGRKKAIETSFGKSNRSNALEDKGIKIKRQNGDLIKENEIENIEISWDLINRYLGNLTNIAAKYDLTISHTGSKLVFARKAVGVFVPRHHAIAVSMKYGSAFFNAVMSHEVAHLLDYLLGRTTGKRYASDNYESTAGKLGKAFRSLMNKKTDSKYINSTKECLARSVEQYFSVKTLGAAAKVDYIESLGPGSGLAYYHSPFFVNEKNFKSIIEPLVKEFLKEALEVEKSNVFETLEVERVERLKGLSQASALRLDFKNHFNLLFDNYLDNSLFYDNGLNGSWHAIGNPLRTTTDEKQRLKKGYKYVKGGAIKKVPTKKRSARKALVKKVSNTPMLDAKKTVATLTDAEITQIGKEYASDILWKKHITDYVGKVLEEKNRRQADAKKIGKDGQIGLFGKEKLKGLDAQGKVLPGYHYIKGGILVKAKSKTKRSPQKQKSTKTKTGTSKKTGLGNPIIVAPNALPFSPKQKKEGRYSAADIMNMEFEKMMLPPEWARLFPDAPEKLHLAFMGKPKNGKSMSACQWGAVVGKGKKVLYNFADQGVSASTKKILSISGLAKSSTLVVTSSRTLDALEQDIKDERPDYVFVDMINNYIDNDGATPQEFENRFIHGYPDISFSLIFEATKTGDFKGDQKWTHIVDQLITVEDYVMFSKGRYGSGKRLVWPEEVKRCNPSKYEEVQEALDLFKEENGIAVPEKEENAISSQQTITLT